MYKTYKVSVNPYIFGVDETMKRTDEELLQRISSIFSIGNDLAQIKPSRLAIFDTVQNGVSFEYKGDNNGLAFYINSSKHSSESIGNFIQSVYPVSTISKVDQETKLMNNFGLENRGGDIQLKEGKKISHTTILFNSNDVSAIRNFQDSKTDFMNNILNHLSALGEGIFSRYQLTFIPANHYWKSKIKKRDMSTQNYKEDKSLLSTKKETKTAASTDRTRVDELVKNKSNFSHGYFCALRVFFIGNDQHKMDEKLTSIKSVISMLSADKTKISFNDEDDFLNNYYNSIVPAEAISQGSLMVSTEMTTLIHPPIHNNLKTKNIDVKLFQKLPLPPQIIKTKEEISDEEVIYGVNDYSIKENNYFSLDYEARFRHTYLMGQSGVGKSTMILNAALQDIYNGDGLCLIDPHGDLVEDIMKHFPDPRDARNPKLQNRYKDLIYIDFGDEERQVGINLLEAETDHEATKVINTFITILKKMFPDSKDSLGPYFEDYVRNICKTIMKAKGKKGKEIFIPVLGDIVRILQSEDYREYAKTCLDEDEDIDILKFWIDHDKQTGDESQSQNKDEIVPHIRTKFTQFLGNEYVHNVVGQEKTTIDFFEAMNTNKIILVKLSKGKIGPENMKTLGLIFMAKLLNEVFKRESLPKEERKPFFLYVDEFQNFVTKEFESLFSEARKYNFGMTVANQYLNQLIDSETKDESVLKSVMGNAGTFMSFQAGPDDAKKLEEYFGGRQNLPAESFLNIEKYYAYVKTVGSKHILSTLPPFTIKTLQPDKPRILKRESNGKIIRDSNNNPSADYDMINMIINYSKDIYTRDKKTTKDHVKKFSKFFT